MATPKLSNKVIMQAVHAVEKCGGNVTAASLKLGVSRTTLQSRLAIAKLHGTIVKAVVPTVQTHEEVSDKKKIKALEKELSSVRDARLNEEIIRREIINLSSSIISAPIPEWMVKENKAGSPGVPSLFLSDLHWGEHVNESQINFVNSYSIDIAKERLRRMAQTSVQLLKIISPKMDYPGLVLILGGDMISGNIHDELTATNELNTMPTVLDLYGELLQFVKIMADQFGRVFIPCVTGNHGRDTQKIWNKDRHATSFDWLLYCFLAKYFESDKRITFFIPDGPDAYYKIYNHRYLLTHGDQFRGGDGVIGALGPIIRGDHRKRSRNTQIDMEYDTLLIGHWHQYIQLGRLIVNGSLKGYDEYAYSNNFPFETPQQALWLTHPKHGITYRMPVKLEAAKTPKESPWCAVK
jgi:transposase-like protein